MRQFFPEIDSIPHSETIARLLGRIDLSELESIHINMVKSLLNSKKFNPLLINGALPISIDGTQKAVRDNQLQPEGWLLRTIRTTEAEKYQQYVYVVEANITFYNGLSIPLLTEYCYLDVDFINDETTKQDSELTAFHRLAEKIKKYFPRRQMILLLDNLYACKSVIATCKEKRWDFMIKLPAKLKSLYLQLEALRDMAQPIPGQLYYRERKQLFHWINNLLYHGHLVHIMACYENWPTVCPETAEIKDQGSKHTWISSQPLSIENVHLLCNLAARKRGLIEDSNNTEKNRGYQYQHLFSYNWDAMKGFHMLMRLAHAINAISEFTKSLKKFIRNLGCRKTFNRIFDAISHRWLSVEWIKKQLQKKPKIIFEL